MDELPGQAVACMLGHLPLRERSRLACVCRTWRAASGVQLEAREARQAERLTGAAEATRRPANALDWRVERAIVCLAVCVCCVRWQPTSNAFVWRCKGSAR